MQINVPHQNPRREVRRYRGSTQDFLQKRYEVDYKIPFERVQRMGIWSELKEQSVIPLQKFHTIKTENLYDKHAAKRMPFMGERTILYRN